MAREPGDRDVEEDDGNGPQRQEHRQYEPAHASSTASTLLNELGWNPDAIERQLAHDPRDKVRAAYNSAQHLPERRKMMQAWADYLDGLKSSAKLAPIRRGGMRQPGEYNLKGRS